MAGENPHLNRWVTALRLPRQWKVYSRDGVAIVWAHDAAEADEHCRALLGDCRGGALLPTRPDGR
jgi:hypothetical protein